MLNTDWDQPRCAVGVVAVSLPHPLVPICGQTSLALIIRSGYISPQDTALGWSGNVCLCLHVYSLFGRGCFHSNVFPAIHTVHIRLAFCSRLSGTRADGPQSCGVVVSVGLLHPSRTERRMGRVWCAFNEGTVIRLTVSPRRPA